MRDYWEEEKFKPLWWPEDITFNKLKLKSKKDLLLIIESYKAFSHLTWEDVPQLVVVTITRLV